MLTIKQPDGSSSCVLACAAMICGMSLSRVENDLRSQSLIISPIGLRELTFILLEHGKFPGLLVNWRHATLISPTETSHLELHCSLNEHDAILTVVGGDESIIYHAVVWDSKCGIVRDPLPHLPDEMNLEQYRILQWMAITDISDTHW